MDRTAARPSGPLLTRPIRTLKALLVGLSLGLTAACVSPGSGPPNLEDQRSYSSDVPDWVGLPAGWKRLEAIEAWLASEEASRDSYWRVEGELRLAEGRLNLLEDAVTSTPATALDSRRSLALSGFERVLSDESASSAQRSRARLGMQAIEGPTRVQNASMPGVVPRARWGAAASRPRDLTSHRGRWRYVTVHHSALYGAGAVEDTFQASVVSARTIQRAHMNNGYGDVGYHFLIDPAGRVLQGREMRWQGAHAGGNNNVGNIGICVLGNFDENRPTRAAVASLDRLIDVLRARYSIPRSGVKAHQDWKSTVCPGKHLMPYVRNYK